jgi:hypothetical protein
VRHPAFPPFSPSLETSSVVPPETESDWD